MTLNKQFVALRNGIGESSGCTGNTSTTTKKVQGESVKQLSTTLLILIN